MEDITTLQLTPYSQLWLQNHYGSICMEFQVVDPTTNEFEYCLPIDTLYDIDKLLEELNTIGLDKFIEKYEENFI